MEIKGINMPEMSKIQEMFFKKMTDAEKLTYIATFLGQRINQYDRRIKPRPVNFFDFGNLSNKTQPKIYKKGEFQKVINEFYRTDKEKKPTISKRGFVGVEIECYLPQCNFDRDYVDCENDDCSEYGECTCDYLEYTYLDSVRRKVNSLKIKGIQIVEDGSLANDLYHEDDSYFGLEFKCLTNVEDFSNLKKLIDWLNDNGAIVNGDCGLHIHLDSRHLKSERSKKLIAEQFEIALPFLSKMVPNSRNNSTYCLPRVCFNDRYSAINMTALKKHGTIEVRLHSGSINFEKITNWINLNYSILNCRHLRKIQPKTLKDFFNVLGLTEKLKIYFLKRIYKFDSDYLLTELPLFNKTLEEIEDKQNVA